MEITHTTGEKINTDTLPDVEAMIMEKSEELRKLCADNHRHLLLIVDAKGTKSRMTHFWSMKTKEEMTAKEYSESYNVFFDSINNFVKIFSRNTIALARVENSQ